MGGADSTISLNNNGSVEFIGNTASSTAIARGGAIFGDFITLSNNGSVEFSGNTASSRGGAIYDSGDFSELIVGTSCVVNNKSVVFKGNSASCSSSSARGGAIRVDDFNKFMLSNNGNVEFIGNVAISGSGSHTGGGAIYVDGSTFMLCDNGSVKFSGNRASNNSSVYGGAIYTNAYLDICNNDSVLFEKNVEKSGDAYRLRCIYADSVNPASQGGLSFSAAAGKGIEFQDSVYVSSGITVNLNADYTDTEGNTIKQQGDIIFTGKYTELHLNEILEADGAGRTATAEEIQNSRTSIVETVTNLYGGRLRVEDGAIYKGQGITAHEGSGVTVRVQDAELSHAGYQLEFNSGTALEVVGQSTIRGNVNLKEGSLFKLEQAASLSLHETLEADVGTLTVDGGTLLEGASTLNASLTLAAGATLDMDKLDAGAVTINGALTFGGPVTMGNKLLSILSEMSGWEESVTLFTGLTGLVLPAVAADEAADRVWVGDVFSNLAGNENYYFNYVPEVGSLAVVYVPEPATATLSLLALAALAARRRRK